MVITVRGLYFLAVVFVKSIDEIDIDNFSWCISISVVNGRNHKVSNRATINMILSSESVFAHMGRKINFQIVGWVITATKTYY